MPRLVTSFLIVFVLVVCARLAAADDAVQKSLIRDIASIEGVRENPVLGYGVVVGLKGTGDRQQTIFTTQTLANMLQRMGVQVSPTTLVVKNVAAVFVTANLPPFARPGTRLDVTVSSTGDAISLDGGMLLLTPLYGVDGRIYAAAQGPLTLGGYTAGKGTNAKQSNHPTVARIPGGGTVERDTAVDLSKQAKLSLLLNDPNFTTAEEIAAVINHEFGREIASVTDSRQVDINDAVLAGVRDVPALLARVENLTVQIRRQARVVVNERTGTVVMGKDVRLGAVSILHGGLSIEISTQFSVSQPAPLSQGQTSVVAQPTVTTEESAARRIELTEGARIEELVTGLQKIGATARDVIAILQAIKAAGALEADLEVI